MLFNSLEFLAFLPVVLLLYYAAPGRAKEAVLVVAGFVFYMFWNVRYSGVLAFFVLWNYAGGLCIARFPGRPALIASVAGNLLVLAVFKYTGFFFETLAQAGVVSSAPHLGLLPALGISFLSFRAINYLIDVSREDLPVESDLLRFATYITFFPQLVAGPIDRARDFLPQLLEERPFSMANFEAGTQRIIDGLVKKVVLADNIAPWVNRVYAAPGDFSGFSAVLAAFLYAWQLYFDFSGYSDIAIGVARMLGIRGSENFDRPYGALNLADYWRRWHITFSSWLREYLYTPLATAWRNGGRPATVLALFVTFGLSGLWHGAAWGYVVWGLLHGMGLSAELLTRRWRKGKLKGRAWDLSSQLATFSFVCFTLIFFRGETVAKALAVIRRIVAWAPGTALAGDFNWYKFLLVAAIGAVYLAVREKWPAPRVSVIGSACAVLLLVLFGAKSDEFLYFAF
jgi:alginate O-acetyltransferase complex protein AlgI